MFGYFVHKFVSKNDYSGLFIFDYIITSMFKTSG